MVYHMYQFMNYKLYKQDIKYIIHLNIMVLRMGSIRIACCCRSRFVCQHMQHICLHCSEDIQQGIHTFLSFDHKLSWMGKKGIESWQHHSEFLVGKQGIDHFGREELRMGSIRIACCCRSRFVCQHMQHICLHCSGDIQQGIRILLSFDSIFLAINIEHIYH